MRIAVVSDVHANLTALEAVIADLRKVAPDLIVQGGDLCSGSKAAEVIDRIRDLGWPGVYGNGDELLWDPDKAYSYLESVGLHSMIEIVRQQFDFTVAALGSERIAWIRALPIRWQGHDLTVVHASPDDVWRSPGPEATDDELVRTYGVLGTTRVVYGHIHRPFVRRLPSFVLGNSGCLSLSYDRDPRAAYAVVDEASIEIRRVEYDIEREARAMVDSGFPYAAWMSEILRKAQYVPPPENVSSA